MPRLRSVLWELPQDLLGAAALAGEAVSGRIVAIEVEDGRLVIESTGTGVSLGHFVFWSRRDNRWHLMDERNRAHELGHAKQSALLGPLYLPIVGVPSVGRAVYAMLFREVTGARWTRYYEGFPERWADELGGVDRAVAPWASRMSEHGP